MASVAKSKPFVYGFLGCIVGRMVVKSKKRPAPGSRTVTIMGAALSGLQRKNAALSL